MLPLKFILSRILSGGLSVSNLSASIYGLTSGQMETLGS